jgi:predicted nuclease of restriction endonuclease-like (RecB) superfamily
MTRNPEGWQDRTDESPECQATLQFKPILGYIQESRRKALAVVNHTVVDLYWRIGEHLSRKTEVDGWGKGTVAELATWLIRREPNLRGFSSSNLWRMKQFYETYRGETILATLLRELSRSHNILVFTRCGNREEREYYLRTAVLERWGVRELERQINGSLFERSLADKRNLSAALREVHQEAAGVFRDRYLVEFLHLPEGHSEKDLQRALVQHLKYFLLELGRDFCFVGREYPIQVGSRDFHIDLLFFHRGLQALVAFELKVGEFEPGHLGQLSFYLEALDRDHRKPHEAPSIGVLLCKSRDSEVVEYSLSRTLSPALVAEYQVQLPDKKLLQAKLEEFYAMVDRGSED